jgi:hypothetical protein
LEFCVGLLLTTTPPFAAAAAEVPWPINGLVGLILPFWSVRYWLVCKFCEVGLSKKVNCFACISTVLLKLSYKLATVSSALDAVGVAK